jgi:hypothetical protein
MKIEVDGAPEFRSVLFYGVNVKKEANSSERVSE